MSIVAALFVAGEEMPDPIGNGASDAAFPRNAHFDRQFIARIDGSRQR